MRHIIKFISVILAIGSDLASAQHSQEANWYKVLECQNNFGFGKLVIDRDLNAEQSYQVVVVNRGLVDTLSRVVGASSVDFSVYDEGEKAVFHDVVLVGKSAFSSPSLYRVDLTGLATRRFFDNRYSVSLQWSDTMGGTSIPRNYDFGNCSGELIGLMQRQN